MSMQLKTNFLKEMLSLVNNDRGNLSLAGDINAPTASGDAGSDGGVSDPALHEPTGAPSLTPNDGPGKSTTNFLAGLDPAIAEDPSLKVFLDSKGELQVNKLVNSYIHAQKAIGKKGVMLPDKYATDED